MPTPDDDPQHDVAWRRSLARLDGQDTPGQDADRQTVAALQRSGVLRPPVRRTLVTRVLTSAAGLTLLLIGAWWGRSSLPEATGDRPRFVLFLLEDSLFLGTRAVGHDSLVAEYTGWASGLAQQGHLVLGEELDESRRVLGMAAATDATSLDVITGLFVLSAANLDEAMTLARTSPHLRYGGGILVRPVLRGESPAR